MFVSNTYHKQYLLIFLEYKHAKVEHDKKNLSDTLSTLMSYIRDPKITYIYMIELISRLLR